jgi:lipopolysaccharide transport system ATP-binding protein
MTDLAIQAERLGKRFRIGRRNPFMALRDDLESALRTPFRLVRSLVHRPSPGGDGPPDRKSDILWALKDVSFEIQRGEVVGIIGSNGAGKSVLLRVLARVTRPSTGRARIYGRVGSMLEVETGFHPELNGRENIYLSGAILGMKKAEIDRKFDEIVAFSEVEPFLETPVKHYSSGMRVRLAFAVAGHLEPEIMLLDEVLAVSDTAFEEKCLQKLKEMASAGRTVLFVSHDMNLIHRLCDRVMLFSAGQLVLDGGGHEVIPRYLAHIANPGATHRDS